MALIVSPGSETAAAVARSQSTPSSPREALAERAVQRFLRYPHDTARGSTIEALQRGLNLFGARPRLTVDTVNGPKTEGAVRNFLDRSLPDLRRGDGYTNRPAHRAEVRRLQRALNILGANLEVDGCFGPNTESALIAWQSSLGASNPSPEGVVNRATWNTLLCHVVERLDSGESSLPYPVRSPTPPASRGVHDAFRAPTNVGVRASGTARTTRTPSSSGAPTTKTAGEVTSPSTLPPPTASFDPGRAYATLLPQLEAAATPAERVNLRSALHRYVTAYASFTRDNPGAVRGRYGMLVNFGARNDESGRGFIVDMQNLSLMRGPMPVSHGHGEKVGGRWPIGHTLSDSGLQQDYGAARSPFSNTPGSEKSSLGVYTTFPLSGRHKGQYERVGLNGHSTGFNDRARGRGVYMHGVPNQGYRTQGCPGFTMTERVSADGVVESDNAAVQRLLEGEPSFVFLDAPVASWHQNDRWLAGASAPAADETSTSRATGTFDVRTLGSTVGLRNNNPWNVKSFGSNRWRGETGRDRRNHATFDDARYSARAAAMQLRKYYTGTSRAAGGRELKTLRQIFNVYAPASDTVGSLAGNQANRPNAYAAWVARQMGISPTADIQLVKNGRIDPDVAVPLLDAIARYENYRSLDLPDGLIRAGLTAL